MNTPEKEKDNIYVYDEDEIDTSPLNYAAYDLDNEDEEIENKENQKDQEISGSKSSFGLLFKIMFQPVEGWKDLRRRGLRFEELQTGCFYPLLAVLAISKFAEYFYSVNVSLAQLVTEAIVAFVSFFFGFYSIQMVLSWILPEEVAVKMEERYGKEYLIISLSTLAIFSILTDLLPMLWPILIFLPIWTLYIMFKGVRFFKLDPSKEMKFYILTVVSVIGIPLLLEWGLNFIMPY